MTTFSPPVFMTPVRVLLEPRQRTLQGLWLLDAYLCAIAAPNGDSVIIPAAGVERQQAREDLLLGVLPPSDNLLAIELRDIVVETTDAVLSGRKSPPALALPELAGVVLQAGCYLLADDVRHAALRAESEWDWSTAGTGLEVLALQVLQTPAAGLSPQQVSTALRAARSASPALLALAERIDMEQVVREASSAAPDATAPSLRPRVTL